MCRRLRIISEWTANSPCDLINNGLQPDVNERAIQKSARRVFFADGRGTKHALAEILSERFPEELGSRLPPKRRAWMSEDYRMGIFDAVALILMLRLKKTKRTLHLPGSYSS
jgi:hypothetical protein